MPVWIIDFYEISGKKSIYEEIEISKTYNKNRLKLYPILVKHIKERLKSNGQKEEHRIIK